MEISTIGLDLAKNVFQVQAVEGDERTIAQQLDDAPMVSGDGGIGQLARMARDGAGLVGLHCLGVTNDIAGQS